VPNIFVLPSHISNLIAAGEVVERPSSVVKELLENSADAGSSSVTMEIKNGGVSFIRCTDNGSGMDKEDAASAFLRHATSKIRAESDLDTINTMGFRGEALAAIASVSRIELMTRTPDSELGFSVMLEGGKIISMQESGCPQGTTIVVRDLFFNTPGRRKFLKKDSTEAAHVNETVLRAALGLPNISMRLIKNGSTSLHTPGDGSLKNCVYSLLGLDYTKNLVEVQRRENNISVSGFTGKPETARAGRSGQYFMLLGRPIKSKLLFAALNEAYLGFIPAGKSPVCVLHLSMPPDEFDVNVHPAKTEVKFKDEKMIFHLVYHAVRTALDSSVPGKSISVVQSPALPLKTATEIIGDQTVISPSGPMSESFSRISPQVSREPIDLADSSPSATPYPGTIVYTRSEIEAPKHAAAAETAPLQPQETVCEKIIPRHRYIGEALGGFLLAETKECLWIIDKHAAHERLLYNKLSQGGDGLMSQQFIAPVMVTLTASECDTLVSHQDFLKSIGFCLEMFGQDTIAVRAGPCELEHEDIPSALSRIAQLLCNGQKPDLRENALCAIACKAAVKLGRSSKHEDMECLCKRVLESNDLLHCPHGRPVSLRLSGADLRREFGR